MTMKPILTLPLIVVLTACGGGGTTSDGEAISNLNSVVSTDQLQALNLSSDGVALASTTKAASEGDWNTALKGDYVVILDNGDIVGIAAATIPTTAIDFAGTEQATAYFMNGGSEVGYQLNGGDVSGTIGSDGALNATISNFRSQTAEVFRPGDNDSQYQDDVIVATINSTLSGITECGAANLLCGGQIAVTVNGTNEAAISATASEAMIGVYGNSGSYELGGRINATDATNNDSFTGSFIATEQ